MSICLCFVVASWSLQQAESSYCPYAVTLWFVVDTSLDALSCFEHVQDFLHRIWQANWLQLLHLLCSVMCRNVSGTRVLTSGKQQTIAGITFQDYGTHITGYPHPYMNAAAAIGGSKQEVDVFLGRLVKAYKELQGKWGTP